MNHYELLGIKSDCSETDIKKAYRKMALLMHPDKNPNDPTATENFKKINEAYTILSDSKKRYIYDLSIKISAREFYEDPIKEFWKSRSYNRPPTVHYHINVSLYDLLIFKGRNIKIEKFYMPIHLSLIGVADGAVKNFSVKLDNNEVRDIRVTIHYCEEQGFKLDGFNLILEKEVSFWKILFGGGIRLKLLDGKVKVSIPRKNYQLKSLKVHGKGLFITETTRGDLILKINIAPFGIKILNFLKKLKII